MMADDRIVFPQPGAPRIHKARGPAENFHCKYSLSCKTQRPVPSCRFSIDQLWFGEVSGGMSHLRSCLTVTLCASNIDP